MKTGLTAILALSLAIGAVATDASATARWRYRVHHRGHVAANGRCGGISYGTGARSCGTRTGGPVGGINSRN